MDTENAFIAFWDDYAIPEKSPHQHRDIAEAAFIAGRNSAPKYNDLIEAMEPLIKYNFHGLPDGENDVIAANLIAASKGV